MACVAEFVNAKRGLQEMRERTAAGADQGPRAAAAVAAGVSPKAGATAGGSAPVDVETAAAADQLMTK